ncbi:hypothetical protein Hanom_Chr09g00788661 [Helianthus anomalus]
MLTFMMFCWVLCFLMWDDIVACVQKLLDFLVLILFDWLYDALSRHTLLGLAMLMCNRSMRMTISKSNKL